MKVYIVTSGIYSDYQIHAVFTDREKAHIYCALYNQTIRKYGDPYNIEEYETNDFKIESQKKSGVLYSFWADPIGKAVESHKYYIFSEDVEDFCEKCISNKENTVFLEEENDEKAQKIFFDRKAKEKAESEGL